MYMDLDNTDGQPYSRVATALLREWISENYGHSREKCMGRELYTDIILVNYVGDEPKSTLKKEREALIANLERFRSDPEQGRRLPDVPSYPLGRRRTRGKRLGI